MHAACFVDFQAAVAVCRLGTGLALVAPFPTHLGGVSIADAAAGRQCTVRGQMLSDGGQIVVCCELSTVDVTAAACFLSLQLC